MAERSAGGRGNFADGFKESLERDDQVVRGSAAQRRMVLRRELFTVLSSAPAGGATLVCAPAGSGKTALLQTWLADADALHRTAWVSIERDERDAQRFWRAVVGQLSLAAGQRSDLDVDASIRRYAADEIVRRLLATLAEPGGPIVLVIDDLHELDSPEALGQLQTLVSKAPQRLRVVLAARRDPQLGLHRLRVAGQLTELREADLRFSRSDARALLRAAGVRLSEPTFDVLYNRTEGWVAGLRLAAISLEGHPDPQRFVEEFSGTARTVADYLFAEVLDRHGDDVRRLLARTSVLERVNGPLADLLTGGSGSEAVLQSLADAGAFVTAIDSEQRWFRYHHLFADLLRLELRRTAPEDVPRLHVLAARWHAEQGNTTEAVRHAQMAEDWRLAARLLSERHHSLSLDGQGATAHALFAAFPDDAPGTGADLALVAALDELMHGSPDAAAEHVEIAERLVVELPEPRRWGAELRLAVVRLSLARRRGDFEIAASVARSFDQTGATRSSANLGLANDARALTHWHLGTAALMSWRLEDAERHLLDGRELARRIGRSWIEVGCSGQLAMARLGRAPTLARSDSQAALALADLKGWGGEPIVAAALLALAATDILTVSFHEAEDWLARAEAAMYRDADPVMGLVLHHDRALLRSGQGRLDEALEELAAARRLHRRLADPTALTTTFRSALLEATTLARQGLRSAAHTALRAIDPDHHRRAEYLVARAGIQIADAPQEALSTLTPVLDGSAPALSALAPVEGCLLAAGAHVRLGDDGPSPELVERALGLAEPGGMVLPFLLDAGRTPLENHSEQETAHAAFLTRIRDVLSGSADGQAVAGAALDPLSPGELRVLGHLPSNLTLPEIAGELFVSTNTIKTHIRHIYAKLGAHSRGGAVDRARKLGLLAPPAFSASRSRITRLG